MVFVKVVQPAQKSKTERDPMQSIARNIPKFTSWGLSSVHPMVIFVYLSHGGHFKKGVETFSIFNLEALTIAKVVVNQWILNHGVSFILRSDQGPNFASNIIKELCKLLDIIQNSNNPIPPTRK